MRRPLLASLVGVLLPVLSPAQDLFPFVLPWDDAAPGVTDMSHLLSAPAGARGRVHAADGHLYVGDGSAARPRERFRIWGVNVSFAGNFPTREDAPKVAARLAKFGVNCVRFHHMDRDPAPKGIWSADLLTIDPEQLDRLDYFIAELKRRGIYANINLHVSRYYPGFPRWDGMPPFFKGVDLFHPGMIAMQRDYARELLSHRNPHTGLTYAEDPAVALVEINNENGLVSRWWEGKLDTMPAIYAGELTRQWRVWRAGRGLPAGEDVSMVSRRSYDELPEAARLDWMRFLWETEKAYWVGFRRFLKDELEVRSLIVGTQLYSYSVLPIQAEMDVIDIHAYWEHPETKDGRWTVGNTSIVNSPDARTIADLSLQRAAGKPLIVTEYNHSAPNTYGAEAFPLIAAYGAMQDWDGIFAYSYAHLTNRHWGNGMINGMFDIDQHSVKMATLAPSAAIFLRGDVAPSAASDTVVASEEQFLEICARHGVNIGGDFFGAKRHDALRRRQYVRLAEAGGEVREPATPAYAGPIRGDDGALVWDAAAPKGVVTLDTPRAKGLIGFTDEREFQLGAVRFRPGRTRQGWSTLVLTQKDGEGLGGPGSALLVAAGHTENTGMVWRDERMDHVTSWGRSPVLVEGIPADVTLETSGAPVSVWALDESGRRRDPLPIRTEDGRAAFSIGPEHKTLWYEIVVSPPAR